MAMRATELRIQAFEEVNFDHPLPTRLTVLEAWALYEPISKRDNSSSKTDVGRAKHLCRHLGEKRVMRLTWEDVDGFRNRRFGETTCRGKSPAPATLDREVELIKRFINYAVKCGRIPSNPLTGVKLLDEPNTRESVVDEVSLDKLLEKATPHLMPIILVAYDSGMRQKEVRFMRWSQVNLKEGIIRLEARDTKSKAPRIVPLTQRVIEELRHVPRDMNSKFVFVNPKTGRPWWNIGKGFDRACERAGIDGVWFHDLRRSFITNARRRGVPESVIMRVTGHKTRAVFERYNIISEEDLRDAISTLEMGRRAELAQGEQEGDVGAGAG